MTFDVNSFLCTKQRSTFLLPMAIPVDTKPAMVDVCRKFGSDVYLGGNIKSLEDIQNIREALKKCHKKWEKFKRGRGDQYQK